MSDRELLELAAKAAGIEYDFCRPELGGCQVRKGLVSGWWNPLTDDGDALRLAVKLGIQPCWFGPLGYASAACVPDLPMPVIAIQEYGNDPYASTRRAIVRAAAAIVQGEGFIGEVAAL